jgi:hypothetical protein
MIQMLLGSLLPGLFKLGDKMIVNEDKKMEFAFKTQEMTFKVMEVMLATKTYPWIDGLVKLAYASEAIIKGLFRPVISAGLFIYGLTNPDLLKQLHELGVIGDTGILGMFGAFPAWMKSRHDEKKQKPVSDDDW